MEERMRCSFRVQLGWLLFLCTILNYSACKKTEENPSQPEVTYAVKTFQADSEGWGYDIYASDKLFIHQQYVPVISGNQSFRNESDALRTANLVIRKLREHVIPPTLSSQEIDSLNVVR